MDFGLAARLEAVASSAPERVAIREAKRDVSFGRLWEECSGIAGDLARSGAREGDVVALVSSNSASWLAALFGALRAGCVVAVLDPKLPAEQVAAVLRSLAPAAVFAEDRLTFPPAADAPLPRLDLRAQGGALLYFTSGSTGLPKGVLLAEATLAENVTWNTDVLALGKGDVGSLVLPLSHSYNLVFALCFLLSGATLCLERDLADLQGAVARMDAAGTTVLQAVPTSLRTLVDRGDLERFPLRAIRAVRVGAGVLTGDLAERTFRALPAAKIVATYGMTELGLVAWRTWTGGPIAESTFDHLVPGLGLEVRDADETGEGEIEVTHPLLFLGYFDAQERSLSTHRGAYRTGDLAAFVAPGVFALRSRKKAVAKVAGVLLNLDEVARVAGELPGVADACAIGVPHPVFGEAIHVFVAAAPGTRPDVAAIAAAILHATLLRVSPRVHVLDRLPRIDSGKLARSALEAMARAREDAPA